MTWKCKEFRTAIENSISIYEEHINEIKTIGDFYKCIDYTKGDWSGVFNLVSMLSNMINAHVETVGDLVGCLYDLQTIFADIDDDSILHTLASWGIEHSGQYTYSEQEIATLLNGFDYEKYKFEDRSRFYGLQTITDCDFIDYKNLNQESYNLVYGILLNSTYTSGIYDCIAVHYNDIKHPVLRKSLLLHWDKLFQKVIEGIEHCLDKSGAKELRVYIPFLGSYEELASHTIEIFKLAQDITRLLRDTDCKEELDAEELENLLPMKEMMEEYAEYMMGEGFGHVHAAVYDEIARRGLVKNVKHGQSGYSYLSDVVGKIRKDEAETEEKEGIPSYEEATMNRKIAVVFYMLSSTNATTDIMHRIAHYLIHDDKEWKGTDNGKATIYNYLRRLIKNDPPFLSKQDDIDYVKNTLLKYGMKEEAEKVK